MLMDAKVVSRLGQFRLPRKSWTCKVVNVDAIDGLLFRHRHVCLKRRDDALDWPRDDDNFRPELCHNGSMGVEDANAGLRGVDCPLCIDSSTS